MQLFVSCYLGWSGLSSEAAASESHMLLYGTPRNLLVNYPKKLPCQGRHGCSHFVGGSMMGVLSWVNRCLLMCLQEKLHNKPSTQYSHLPNPLVSVW